MNRTAWTVTLGVLVIGYTGTTQWADEWSGHSDGGRALKGEHGPESSEPT